MTAYAIYFFLSWYGFPCIFTEVEVQQQSVPSEVFGQLGENEDDDWRHACSGLYQARKKTIRTIATKTDQIV